MIAISKDTVGSCILQHPQCHESVVAGSYHRKALLKTGDGYRGHSDEQNEICW